MPWWLTKDDDGGVSNMNLRMWKDVVMTEKRMLIDQMLVLFPEIINSEFDDAALWLCTTKGIINTHFRDIYTAGGKLKKINGVALDKTLPRVLFYVVNDAMTIKNCWWKIVILGSLLKSSIHICCMGKTLLEIGLVRCEIYY